jgi:LacI family transcriptional regulator
VALPKPVGVAACYDVLGLRLLDACRRRGLVVPEQVAVVGAGNDNLLCSLSDPPLSSVEHNLHQVGYEAAGLLDRMMDGEPAPAEPILVEPLGVVARQSTELVAIADPKTSLALHVIRDRACQGIGVDEVARRVSLSRRALERRFHKYVGRSPHDEIVRLQLERVKTLLRESDLTLDAIAQKAGFNYASYMATLFRTRVGQPPGEYRRRSREV